MCLLFQRQRRMAATVMADVTRIRAVLALQWVDIRVAVSTGIKVTDTSVPVCYMFRCVDGYKSNGHVCAGVLYVSLNRRVSM